MEDSFDQLLDTCLDRLARGEDIERVLASCPDDANELRPLLETAARMSTVKPVTDAGKKAQYRVRFDNAAARAAAARAHRTWYAALLRPGVLVPVATAAVILLVTLVGVRTAFSPGTEVVVPVKPLASPDGNFRFLVSDDVNAIADFNSVVVGISRISLQQADSRWVEFEPTVKTVDLTAVPGDAVEEIWQGDVPPGSYKQVSLYVDNVTGTLKTGGSAEIKLPSQKLRIAVPFDVSDDAVTSFTYDITVIQTGNGDNSRYILKPQANESGAIKSSKTGGRESSGNISNAGGNPQGNDGTKVHDERPSNVPPGQTKEPKK